MPVQLAGIVAAPLRLGTGELLGAHTEDGFHRRTAHDVDHRVNGRLTPFQELDQRE